LEILPTLEANSVQCVVTSPPYYGLRDYGAEGQIGLEDTPEAYVGKLVAVFSEVKRVLRDDGVVWLNLGDSYARDFAKGGSGPNGKHDFIPGYGNARKAMRCCSGRADGIVTDDSPRNRDGCFCNGSVLPIKPKDLIGIPWRVAFALQSDGWWLRQDIIWAKPNPMPESVTDRYTKSHEYIFLLTKSARYYYDAEAVKEPSTEKNWQSRIDRAIDGQKSYPTEKKNGIRSRADSFKREGSKREQPIPFQAKGTHRPDREESNYPLDTRNRRSVWTVTTKPFKEAHFATFPPEIPKICIRAGSKVGDTILDPFSGAGTTGLIADKLGRKYIGIELNPGYVGMGSDRIFNDCPLFYEE